jgi:hypothetical protein
MMKKMTAVCVLAALVLGAGLTARPAQAACGKACQLIKKGLERDKRKCRQRWKAILKQCQAAKNPTVADNCGGGLPIITTSTSTSTTSSTTAPLVCPAPTTTTTTIPCDGSHPWAACGPAGGTCTCHRQAGTTGAYACVEEGVQAAPELGPCPEINCAADSDCNPDCINNPQATIVCIKDAGTQLGHCLCICQGTVCQ